MSFTSSLVSKNPPLKNNRSVTTKKAWFTSTRGPSERYPKRLANLTPPQELFDTRPPFVPANKHRGKHKRGTSKEGYFFGSGTHGIGYYRDTPEDRAARSNGMSAPQDSADAIPVPESMHSNSTCRTTGDMRTILPDWLSRRSRRKHKGGKRIRGGTRESKSSQNLGDLNFTS